MTSREDPDRSRDAGACATQLAAMRAREGVALAAPAGDGAPARPSAGRLRDEARALRLVTLLGGAGADDAARVAQLESRHLAGVARALDAGRGLFRERLAAPRPWADEGNGQDAHGHALWALGSVVARSADRGRRTFAVAVFRRALPEVGDFADPHAWASTLLGIDECVRAGAAHPRLRAARDQLAERLLDFHRRVDTSRRLRPEARAPFGTACRCEALVVSGARIRDAAMVAAGLRSLGPLEPPRTSAQARGLPRVADPRGAAAAAEQRAGEACATVSACLAARRVTGDARWSARAQLALSWFFGPEARRPPSYDARTGSCRDVLGDLAPLEHEGASSALSFLLALAAMRADARARSGRTGGELSPVGAGDAA